LPGRRKSSRGTRWFIIDLLENAQAAGASRRDIAEGLRRSVRHDAFDVEGLREMARKYGTRATQATIAECLKVHA
jgi:hypothetical protein